MTPERRAVHVVVFVRSPPAVLLLLRPSTRSAGWQSVTGKVEPDDATAATLPRLRGEPATPEVPLLVRAALREVQEETGLDLPLEIVDLGLERSFEGYDGVLYHQRSFAARYPAAVTPLATPEHDEARWLPPAEARALARWDSDKVAIEAIASEFTT